MKAMILAAGRGERMRPLTDHTPKPLLPVAGEPIIVHTIKQLVAAGFNEIIINHAKMGAQIEATLGTGEKYGAVLHYSHEGEEALETAGGIINALPLLGNEMFLAVNGDIATDFPFANLRGTQVHLAHLVLVENPEHHPQGDFALNSDGIINSQGHELLTFSGIGLYHPKLFANTPPGKSKLGPLLRMAIPDGTVSGQKYSGFWMDVGTPERLNELDHYYTERVKSMPDHVYNRTNQHTH